METQTILQPEPKTMGVFDRYLSIWVGLCMGAGILIGKDAEGDRARLAELLAGGEIRHRMGEGAARLCRAEFDLEKHVAEFAALLCRTAAGPI